MKIRTYGSSPWSVSRNAWMRIKNINGASCLSNFWNFLARFKWFPVTIGDHGRNMVISLCNNQWGGGITSHPTRPKKFWVQKSTGKVLASIFLVSTRHPPHWSSSKQPNYQRGVLLISAGAIKGHFEGKTPQEGHQGGLVLARQCPGSSGTHNPEETGLPGLPMSWSPTLFSGSSPIVLPPVPWTEKTTERSPFFVRRRGHCCRGDLVGQTTFWIFLSGLQNLEQRLSCDWASGGVCWINPEFGHCSLFPSWLG